MGQEDKDSWSTGQYVHGDIFMGKGLGKDA